MSSTVKAGIFSVCLIAIVIAVIYFRFGTPGDLAFQSETTPAEVVQGETGEHAQPAATAQPSANIQLPPRKGEIVLNVKVIDAQTGRTIPKARLRVFRATLGSGSSTEVASLPDSTTSRATELSCRLAPGTYSLSAFASGYSQGHAEVTLIQGQEVHSETIALERGASISGRVLAMDGTPVAGAEVGAYKCFGAPGASIEDMLRRLADLEKMQREPPQTAISGSDGYYQIDGVSSHEWYDVRATAGGFSPGLVEKVEAPREHVDVRLVEGGLLEGLVTDTAGNAITNASVEVYECPENKNLFDTILAYSRPAIEKVSTDGQGQYRLTQIGGGKYNFRVTAPGFQPHDDVEQKIVPGVGQRKDFRLQPGFTIHGIVRGPDHNPVAGAKVRATERGGAVARKPMTRVSFEDEGVLTDASGHFVLDTLSDSQYMLFVTHDDFESVQREARPSPEELVINLPWGSQLEGMVFARATGEPIAGATVSIPDIAGQRKQATTDQTGRYFLSGLNARPQVTAFVHAPGFARQSVSVRLRKDQKVEQSFELDLTATVRGRVVLGSGDGVAMARIEVRRFNPDTHTDIVVSTGTTDPDGHFEVDDVEPGDGLRVRARRADFLEVRSEPFSLEPGQIYEIPVITLSLGGAVAGHVRTLDGRPIEGCMVSVRDLGETDIVNQGKSVHTLSNGAYEVKGLAAGRYNLEFSAPGFITGTLTDVGVQEGQLNYDRDIALEEAGRIAGRVINTDGQPIALAQVKVQDFSDGVKEFTGITDANGQFEIASIAAKDEVGLIVMHDEYSSYEDDSVDVGSTDLTIVLTPLGRFVGVVVDSQGVRIPNFTVQALPEGNSLGAQRVRAKLRAKTFSGGEFDYAGVPEGVYDVSIGAPSYATVRLAGQVIRGADIVDLGEIVLEEGGRIAGRVVEAGTGRAIAGADVRIVQGAARFRDRSSPTANPLQRSAADGSFTFTDLKEGNVTLEVAHAAFGTVRQAGVNPQLAESLEILIEMERGGIIEGTVLDVNGRPVDGMWVYLGTDNRRTPTNDRGQFTFANVTPGRHTVKAHKFVPNRLPIMAEQEVYVEAGGSVAVDLRVEAP